MAKKSSIARDLKRKKMIDKFASKRAELKAVGDRDGLHLLPRVSLDLVDLVFVNTPAKAKYQA